MQTTFSTTVSCPCCGEKVDAEVTATLSGRYRKATRLDPEETPEVDEMTVTVGEGKDVTDDLSSLDKERIEEEAMERAGEDEAAAREDAAERRAEERRDARMWRD